MSGVGQDRKEALRVGRAAFAREQWLPAYEHLAAADRESALGALDLDRLAVAAQLLDRDDGGLEVWERAHRAALLANDIALAVRCAFWLSMVHLNRHQMSKSAGWLARACRLLEDAALDCAERGYILLPEARQSLVEGEFRIATEKFGRAADIGVRFGESDLVTLARLGLGQASIGSGDVVAGVRLLDEAMVAVTAGELSAIVLGIVYCGVIEACHRIFDQRRATEWTAALTRWCETNPDIVAFKGECLVYRAEVMRVRGDWSAALYEAQRARELLAVPPVGPDLGAAFYQMAEVHRLRGQHRLAEDSYRLAHEHGHDPYPGLAQLRSDEGYVDAAAVAIGIAVVEAHDDLARCRLLPAQVEISLAAGALEEARSAAEELTRIALEWDRPLLHAAAAYAFGRVLLADGDPRAALARLRQARAVFQEQELEYEQARTRVQIGVACRALGDEETAGLEFDTARQVFRSLGAEPDRVRLATILEPQTPGLPGGLTKREMQVLRLIAAGKTNRAIAAELVISEKTVARHVSNILTKLDLPSRVAATAYAYERSLVGPQMSSG